MRQVERNAAIASGRIQMTDITRRRARERARMSGAREKRQVKTVTIGERVDVLTVGGNVIVTASARTVRVGARSRLETAICGRRARRSRGPPRWPPRRTLPAPRRGLRWRRPIVDRTIPRGGRRSHHNSHSPGTMTTRERLQPAHARPRKFPRLRC